MSSAPGMPHALGTLRSLIPDPKACCQCYYHVFLLASKHSMSVTWKDQSLTTILSFTHAPQPGLLAVHSFLEDHDDSLDQSFVAFCPSTTGMSIPLVLTSKLCTVLTGGLPASPHQGAPRTSPVLRTSAASSGELKHSHLRELVDLVSDSIFLSPLPSAASLTIPAPVNVSIFSQSLCYLSHDSSCSIRHISETL